jgi:hypothetical protein
MKSLLMQDAGATDLCAKSQFAWPIAASAVVMVVVATWLNLEILKGTDKLGILQREGAKVISVKGIKPGADLLSDSVYLFHGNLRFPAEKYTADEIRADPPQPPLIGVCVSRDLPLLHQLYPSLQAEFARAKFVCWRVATP